MIRILAVLLVAVQAVSHAQAERRIAPGPLQIKVVSSAGGAPVAGVSVRVGGRYAATSADGTMTLDGISAGDYKIVIEHQEFERFEKAVQIPAGKREPMTLTIVPETSVPVKGKVVLDESSRPIPCAKISFIPLVVPSAIQGGYDLSAGWDGNFSVMYMPTGKYRAEVSAAGCIDFASEFQVTKEIPDVTFKLSATTQKFDLRVTVVDSETSKPLANAKVTVAECFPKGFVCDGKTDAAGSVTLKGIRVGKLNWMDEKGSAPLVRRQVTVRAERDGYEAAVAPAYIGDNSAVSVALSSCEKIAQQEPNNDFATAQKIRTGAPVEFKIDKVGDADFFKFHVSAASVVKVQLAAIPINCITTIFRSDATVIWQRSDWAGAAVGWEGGLSVGDHFVKVEHWGNSAASDSAFKLTVSCTNFPDAFEPNNGFDSAKLVEACEEFRGSIGPIGDIDYFKSEVKQTSIVRVTSAGHPLNRIIRVWNDDRKCIYDRSYWGGAPIDFTVQVDPGTFYVSLQQWGDNAESIEPYTLRIEAIGNDGIDDSPISTGRARVARTIAPNSLVASTILPVGDHDVYSIALPSSGILRVISTAPINFITAIYDSKGKLMTSRTDWACAHGELGYNCTGPAVVYFDFGQWGDNSWSPSPYIVRTFWYPCDEQELLGRNDSADSPIPFEPGESLRGSTLPVGDVDFYRCEIDHPGRLIVDGTSPTNFLLRIFDAKRRAMREQGFWANSRCYFDPEVLPGEYYVSVEHWGNSAYDRASFEFKTSFIRAEAVETLPLVNDAVRTLKLGEAQSFNIDQVGDRDRFVLSVPAAGNFSVRFIPSANMTVLIFDDASGALVREQSFWGGTNVIIPLETKEPARYRIEFNQWGNNNVSAQTEFVLADTDSRDIPAESIAAAADQFDPTNVTFTRTARGGGYAAVDRVQVDADGDGKVDLEVPAGGAAFRYRSEGIYRARAFLTGKNGVKSVLNFWVNAVGARERKGIFLSVDYPAEGQTIETEAPCRARAISYSSARVNSLSVALDGKQIAISYATPFVIEFPWQKIGKGAHKISFTATDAKGQSKTVDRTVELSEYFGLSPADGAVITGNNIRIGWTSPDFCATKVRYHVKGEPNWMEAVGESGKTHSVLLPNLEAGKPYEFQAVGSGEPSATRSFTRVKGLAFGKTKYSATVERNYDQRVSVSVRNHAEKPMVVRLECAKPRDARLLVGFVGEGSEGAPFTLSPGEERDFMLGISAQDVVTALHTFAIRMASENGFTDEADVEINVKLPEVKLQWEEAGIADDGIGKKFHLKNVGDTLTDLDLAFDKEKFYVTPEISHGLLAKGSTLEVTVTPKLSEGFSSAEGAIQARAVGKTVENKVTLALKEGEKIYGVMVIPGQTMVSEEPTEDEQIMTARAMAGMHLDPSYVDWSKKERPEDTDGDGKVDRWYFDDTVEKILWIGDDSDGDGEIDFVHADIGYDGQFDYSAFKAGGERVEGWEQTNLVEAWLEMGFSLPRARSSYEKHDADMVMNGKVIGAFKDTIPEGNYTFKIPPNVIQFNSAGVPEGNMVEIHSKHLRGGHYVVSSDFRIKVRLTGTRAWVVGTSEEDAKKKLQKTEGLSIDGADYSVSSEEMRVEGPSPLKKGDTAVITVLLRNIGATRHQLVTVGLFRAEPGGKGIELSRISVENPPLIGAIPARISWKASAGTHQLRVIVDPDSELNDTERGNNTAMITVVVHGDDSKPTLKILEPADGSVIKKPVIPITVEANDDSGISKVEARIDGALWEILSENGGAYSTRAFLQPGKHTIVARATDGGGNQIEQTVTITVEGSIPTGEFLEPAEGASIDARMVNASVKIGESVMKVVFVVNGGTPVVAAISGGIASASVPLQFGPCEIKAILADSNGARKELIRRVDCKKQKEEKKKEKVEDKKKDDKKTENKKTDDKTKDDKNPEDKKKDDKQKEDDKQKKDDKKTAKPEDKKTPQPEDEQQPGGKKKQPAKETPEDEPPPDDTEEPDEPEENPFSEIPIIDIPDYGPVDIAGEPNVILSQPQKQPEAGNQEAPRYNPPPATHAPAGGLVSVQKKNSDWYCTNRPVVGVNFQLPDWLKKKGLPKPGTKDYYKEVGKLLAQLKMKGVDVDKLMKFQDAMLKRIRGMDQPGELPGWLEAFGFKWGKAKTDEELRNWRDRMEEKTEAWWLKILASGNPREIAEAMKARMNAIGKFDEASKLAAEGAIKEIEAKQKITEDVVGMLPVVGDALDVVHMAYGETLSGEKMTKLDYIFSSLSVAGPALEAIMAGVKKFKMGRDAIENLGTALEKLGEGGRKLLADKLGIPVDKITKAMNNVGEFLMKERSLFKKDLEGAAEQTSKAFKKSADGIADAKLIKKDLDQAEEILDRLKKATPGSQEFDDAVKSLQQNKTAQRIVNTDKFDDAFRKDINSSTKKTYDAVDDSAIKRMKDDPEIQKQIDALAKKHGIDPKDIDIDKMNITNVRPGSKVSVGRDRDITYQFGVRDKDGKFRAIDDVHHDLSTKIYDEEFYKHTKGEIPKGPDGAPDYKKVKENSDNFDQTVTSKTHREAYQTGEVPLNTFLDKGKLPTITRVDEVVDTVKHKSNHWFDRAAKTTDPVEAGRAAGEGMRQATKQFDDLITPRVKQYGGKIPPDLQVKMDIFKKVNRGEISTREAEKMLNSLGTTKEGVVDQMGDFLRNVEKREGDVYRAVKTQELTRKLEKAPDPGSSKWRDDSLKELNDALANGHVTGENFLKLREGINKGIMQYIPAGDKRTWRQWIADSFARRLISAGEKQMFEAEVDKK